MYSLTALVVLAATLCKLAASQTIVPASVDINTRKTWCDNQEASCPLLCLQLPGTTDSTQHNNCSATTLEYQCVCSNGKSPNASEYSQTIPYYECTESNTQCANNCDSSDSSCQTSCRTAHPCGASSPKRYNTTASSTTAAAAASSTGDSAAKTSGGSAVYTGFGSSSTSSSKSDSSNDARALALGFGRSYGLVTVLASVCGAFTLLL